MDRETVEKQRHDRYLERIEHDYNLILPKIQGCIMYSQFVDLNNPKEAIVAAYSIAMAEAHEAKVKELDRMWDVLGVK
jgi:hypothetical protein